MPSYDALHYDPPAPIAEVALRGSNGATIPNVLLLMDTGADTTLLPRAAIRRLRMIPDGACIRIDWLRRQPHHNASC